MDYRITFFLRMKWNDERLRFKELGSPLTMLTGQLAQVQLDIYPFQSPPKFFTTSGSRTFSSQMKNKLIFIR